MLSVVNKTIIMLGIAMLSFIMLYAIMLRVVATLGAVNIGLFDIRRMPNLPVFFKLSEEVFFGFQSIFVEKKTFSSFLLK